MDKNPWIHVCDALPPELLRQLVPAANEAVFHLGGLRGVEGRAAPLVARTADGLNIERPAVVPVVVVPCLTATIGAGQRGRGLKYPASYGAIDGSTCSSGSSAFAPGEQAPKAESRKVVTLGNVSAAVFAQTLLHSGHLCFWLRWNNLSVQRLQGPVVLGAHIGDRSKLDLGDRGLANAGLLGHLRLGHAGCPDGLQVVLCFHVCNH